MTDRQIAALCKIVREASGFRRKACWEAIEGVKGKERSFHVVPDAPFFEMRLVSSGSIGLEELVSKRLAAPSKAMEMFDRQLFRTYLETAEEEVRLAGYDFPSHLGASSMGELSGLVDAARGVFRRMHVDGVDQPKGNLSYSLGFLVQDGESRWFRKSGLYLSIACGDGDGIAGPLLDMKSLRGASLDSHVRSAVAKAFKEGIIGGAA